MALLRGLADSSWVLHYQHGSMARLWLAATGQTTVRAYDVPLPRDSMEIFCGGHAILPDGRFLAAGGTLAHHNHEVGTIGTNRSAIFNPRNFLNAQHGWSMRDTMAIERWYPTMTTLSNGKVLASSGKPYEYMSVIGGRDSSGLQRDLRRMRRGERAIWEADDSQFNSMLPREGHSMSHVPKRALYVVFGGELATGTPASAESVFIVKREPTDQGYEWKWQAMRARSDATHGYPRRRAWHSAVVLGDSIYVYGGRDSASTALGDVWMMSQLDTVPIWKKVTVYSQASPPYDNAPNRYLHTAVLDPFHSAEAVAKPKMLVFGGRINGSTLAEAHVWALHLPRAGNGLPGAQWEKLNPANSNIVAREGHVAIRDPNRRHTFQDMPVTMFVHGGKSSNGSYLDDVWALTRDDAADSVSVDWRWDEIEISSEESPAGRWKHAAIHDLQWDHIRIFGGEKASGYTNELWKLGLGGAVTEPFEWMQDPQSNPPSARIGHAMVEDTRDVLARDLELFDPAAGGLGDWSLMSSAARKHMDYYPMIFQLQSGMVFYAGNGPIQSLAGESHGSFVLDVAGPSWGDSADSEILGGSAAFTGSGRGSVARDTVMKCGGLGSAYYVDLPAEARTMWASIDANGTTTWHEAGDLPDGEERRYHNLTILPTGQVLMTGGLDNVGASQGFRRRPRLWDPKARLWLTLPDSQAAYPLAADTTDRNYHSSALLLPDGRVLSASGSIAPFDPSVFPPAAIYSPPYLFKNRRDQDAVRPIIAMAGGCDTLALGETFRLNFSGVAAVDEVCLMRPGSMTHAFNMDQRRVELAFTTSADTLAIQVPSNPHLLPPGDYMLFLLHLGVPSVSKWVRLQTDAKKHPRHLET